MDKKTRSKYTLNDLYVTTKMIYAFSNCESPGRYIEEGTILLLTSIDDAVRLMYDDDKNFPIELVFLNLSLGGEDVILSFSIEIDEIGGIKKFDDLIEM